MPAPSRWPGAGRLSRQSDIYTLGVSLYQLLTGRIPYDTIEEKQASIAGRQTPPLPSRLIRLKADGAPVFRQRRLHELDRIVLRALNLNAADRYVSASELASDLQKFLEPRVNRPSLAKGTNIAA